MCLDTYCEKVAPNHARGPAPLASQFQKHYDSSDYWAYDVTGFKNGKWLVSPFDTDHELDSYGGVTGDSSEDSGVDHQFNYFCCTGAGSYDNQEVNDNSFKK